MTSKTNSRHAAWSENYHYDAAGRLDGSDRVGSVPGLNKSLDLELDALGNWTKTTFDDGLNLSGTEVRTHNARNQIVQRDDELIETGSCNASPVAFTFDKNGNTLFDGYRTMAYDELNRLQTVVVDNSATVINATPGTYHYVYDALNRRIKSDGVDADGNPETRVFIYDGWRVIEERLVDTSSSNIKYPLDKTYVWGPGHLDELVSVDMSVTRVWDSASETYVEPDSGNSMFRWDNLSATGLYMQRFYVHQDNIYNVTAVTDMSGSVVVEYAYDFTGRRTSTTSTTNPQYQHFRLDYGNTGQRHDPSTGLMYWKNRYYSIELGRFINRDILGYILGFNLYRLYRWLDSWGLGPEDMIDLSTEYVPTSYTIEPFTPTFGSNEKRYLKETKKYITTSFSSETTLSFGLHKLLNNINIYSAVYSDHFGVKFSSGPQSQYHYIANYIELGIGYSHDDLIHEFIHFYHDMIDTNEEIHIDEQIAYAANFVLKSAKALDNVVKDVKRMVNSNNFNCKIAQVLFSQKIDRWNPSNSTIIYSVSGESDKRIPTSAFLTLQAEFGLKMDCNVIRKKIEALFPEGSCCKLSCSNAPTFFGGTGNVTY